MTALCGGGFLYESRDRTERFAFAPQISKLPDRIPGQPKLTEKTQAQVGDAPQLARTGPPGLATSGYRVVSFEADGATEEVETWFAPKLDCYPNN